MTAIDMGTTQNIVHCPTRGCHTRGCHTRGWWGTCAPTLLSEIIGGDEHTHPPPHYLALPSHLFFLYISFFSFYINMLSAHLFNGTHTQTDNYSLFYINKYTRIIHLPIIYTLFTPQFLHNFPLKITFDKLNYPFFTMTSIIS